MSVNLAAFLYLVSGVLFIMALRGLSHPSTSRQGNLYGMVGMGIAIVTTLALARPSWAGFGLIVPALGGRNPVAVTVMAQISNVFVLPLTVAVILVLVNRPALLGKHRAGLALNAGLALALLFSCIIAVTGALALFRQFIDTP